MTSTRLRLTSRLAPLVTTVLALGARAAFGQVGHMPTSSPYLDLEYAQEFTLIGGNYHAHRDPAGVGPQSGMLVGAHYEWRASGPLHLIGEVTRSSSNRSPLDPLKTGPARVLPNLSRPLYSGTFGLGLSLTGAKSWHHFVPEVSGGLGFISDFRTEPDTGGFKFGTRFALNWGAGIRWVPGGRWQVRGDLTNRSYTIGYPEAFFIAPTGGSPILPATQSKSLWVNNPAFTLGLSRLF
jgi:hypothetical protein